MPKGTVSCSIHSNSICYCLDHSGNKCTFMQIVHFVFCILFCWMKWNELCPAVRFFHIRKMQSTSTSLLTEKNANFVNYPLQTTHKVSITFLNKILKIKEGWKYSYSSVVSSGITGRRAGGQSAPQRLSTGKFMATNREKGRQEKKD